MAGDSNARKNFHLIASKLGLTKGSHEHESAWTGAERWDEQSGFRLSFRFVPYMEMRFNEYVTGTLLLDDISHAFGYADTKRMQYSLPASLPQSGKPDVFLWNTGGWEFGDTKKHWHDFWKFVFAFLC